MGNCFTTAKIFKLKNQFPKTTIICDVSAPYIYFDCSMIKNGDTRFKNEPAISNKNNKSMLLTALYDIPGIIDSCSSYHSTVPDTYKFINEGDFLKALNGFYSIGALL